MLARGGVEGRVGVGGGGNRTAYDDQLNIGALDHHWTVLASVSSLSGLLFCVGFGLLFLLAASDGLPGVACWLWTDA